MRAQTLVALLTAGIVLTGCQEPTPESRIQSANEALASGQYDEAVIELKNALQAAPDNLDVRFELAKVLYEQGDLPGAEKELRRVINAGRTDDAIQGMLGFALYYQAKFEDAMLLKGELGDNAAPSLRIVDYLAALKIDASPEKAYASLSGSLDGDEKQLLEALQQIKASEVEKPLQMLNSLNLADYYDVFINQTRAQLMARSGSLDEAIELMSSIAKTWPSVGLLAINYVEMLIADERFDDAEKVLTPWVSNDSRSPWFDLLMADLKAREGDFEAALIHAERAVQLGIETFNSYLLAGVAAVEQEKWEAAYSYLNKAHAQQPENRTASRLLARTQLQLGYFEEATELLERVEAKTTEDINFLLSASAYLDASGRPSEAKELLSSTLQETPQSQALLAQLSILQLATDDNKASESVAALSEFSPNSLGAVYLKIQNFLKQNKFEEAKAEAQRLASEDEVNSLLLQAVVEFYKGSNEQTLALTKQVFELDPANVAALRLAMQSEYRQADLFKAADYAEKIVDITESPRAIDNLVYLLDENSDLDSVSTLKTLASKKDNPTIYRLGVIKSYGIAGKYKEAVRVADEYPDARKILARVAWVNLLYSSGYIERVEEALSEWVREEPTNKDAFLASINYYFLRNESQKAMGVIRDAEATFPSEPQFKIAHFEALLRDGKLEQAKSKLNALQNLRLPEWHLSYYRGQLALMNGSLKQADEELSKAYATSGRFGVALVLAKVKSAKKEAIEGFNLLNESLENSDTDVEKRYHIVAEYALAHGYFQNAVSVYDALIEKWPGSAVAFNNRANAMLLSGDVDGAKASAEKAVNIEPNASHLDTLGWVLFKSEQYEAAVEKLEKAVAMGTPSEEAAAHLALAYQAVGQNGKAKALRQKHDSKTGRYDTLWSQVSNR
ncbi:XrtA/PEP-CTERM system TPR-repeat protein PrsT [Alteromonas sp. H39]|uniref:XrtA/PEP-CTERM system TPR-repeat protein PrsT n=1 Tax=Alteromonas sp. H39 TaxID=3389876 RepID=UPI0039E0E252